MDIEDEKMEINLLANDLIKTNRLMKTISLQSTAKANKCCKMLAMQGLFFFSIFMTTYAQSGTLLTTSRPPWYWKPNTKPLDIYTQTASSLIDRVDLVSPTDHLVGVDWWEEINKRKNESWLERPDGRPPPPPPPGLGEHTERPPFEENRPGNPPNQEPRPPVPLPPATGDSECAKEVIHDRYKGKGYFFSWEDRRSMDLQLTWPQALSFCRARCLELVSIERPSEHRFLENHIIQGRLRGAWTSGRKCDFPGCEKEKELQPIDIYGWFWEGSRTQLPPTTDRFDSLWSNSGPGGRPQPDNHSGQRGGEKESCLAILNNLYNDGVSWHDQTCSQRKPFICEESNRRIRPTVKKTEEIPKIEIETDKIDQIPHMFQHILMKL